MKPQPRPSPTAIPFVLGAILTGSTIADATQAIPQTSRPTARQDPHGIEMDALSKATLDRWEAMEYHLGRAGVRSASFTVKVKADGPLGKTEATGKYTFDGKKGSLKWNDAGLGDMLGARGWSRDTFDRMFVGDSHRRSLAGAALSASKQGEDTVLEVRGKTKGDYKSFRYGKDGVARQFTVRVEDAVVGKRDAVIRLQYEKVGGKYVRVGWTYEMDLDVGGFTGKVTVDNKKVGKFHVYGTVEEKLIMDGQTVGNQKLVFTDYEINGVAEAKKSAGPTSKPSKPDPGEKAATKKKGPTTKPKSIRQPSSDPDPRSPVQRTDVD